MDVANLDAGAAPVAERVAGARLDLDLLAGNQLPPLLADQQLERALDALEDFRLAAGVDVRRRRRAVGLEAELHHQVAGLGVRRPLDELEGRAVRHLEQIAQATEAR